VVRGRDIKEGYTFCLTSLIFNQVSGLSKLTSHHQFHFSIWRVESEILLIQDTLSVTTSHASTQEQQPITICSKISAVLCHVSLGLPLLYFPSSAHVSATHGRELLSIHSMCPIHVHLLLLTFSLIVSILTPSCTSSFDSHIGQQSP